MQRAGNFLFVPLTLTFISLIVLTRCYYCRVLSPPSSCCSPHRPVALEMYYSKACANIYKFKYKQQDISSIKAQAGAGLVIE